MSNPSIDPKDQRAGETQPVQRENPSVQKWRVVSKVIIRLLEIAATVFLTRRK